MNNNEVLKLGNLVAELRKKKGFSQRKFAQISGLSNTTISRIENGETLHPDLETLKLLAAHLDYPETELIDLAASHGDKHNQIRQAKLNFLRQPVKGIKRYSSVSTNLQYTDAEDQFQHININASEETPSAIGQPYQVHEQAEDIALDTEAEALAQTKISIKGMRLITLRMERNITQKELADALGIDKTLISQFEGEIIKPDYSTVNKLAEFFGVKLEYFTGEPNIEMSIIEEPVEILDQTITTEPFYKNTLRPEYLAIAEEIQDAGIEVADVRAFIDMIKRYRR